MNFIQAKQRKERGFSVDDVAKHFGENKNRYTDVVIVALIDGKHVEAVYSTDNDAKLLGIMEVAKSMIIDEIRDCEV